MWLESAFVSLPCLSDTREVFFLANKYDIINPGRIPTWVMAVCLPNSLRSLEQEHYSLLHLFKNKLPIAKHHSATPMPPQPCVAAFRWQDVREELRLQCTPGKTQRDIWPGKSTWEPWMTAATLHMPLFIRDTQPKSLRITLLSAAISLSKSLWSN